MSGFDHKVVVFDLGGTLMEYEGMPLDWSGFYYDGFREVSEANGLNIPDEKIKRSAEIMRSFNPRLTGREVEIAPEVIFGEAIADWEVKPDIDKVADDFFSGLTLRPRVFDYTKNIIEFCRTSGAKVACLTDLPSGMPDRIFKRAITEVTEMLDLYVSSESCGYRKPNKAGIDLIADYFDVSVSEILLVGDEKKDLQTAKNAGCRFLFVNDFIDQFMR
ncbi:MAG: HAD-IA family hydrolase [Clostridia bacterium]|nr:HAD-IA family hydrolase [Clostridia bacterium]